MASIVPLFAVALLASAPVPASEWVGVRNLHAVELRGGGAVELVPGPAERAAITEGNSEVTVMNVDDGKLIIRTCNLHCPPGYRLRVEIESPNVPDLAVDGGGSIVVRAGFGAQAHLGSAVNGGGRIDARNLDARSVTAAINGGGEILVQPHRSLSAAVNGGGHVRYWGNPATSVAIRGGGSVKRGD